MAAGLSSKRPIALVAYSTAAHDDRPVWQSVWRNQFELDGMSQMMAMMAMNYGQSVRCSPRASPRSPAEVLLFGDRVHQSMSISDGVIYSLEGKTVSDHQAIARAVRRQAISVRRDAAAHAEQLAHRL